MLHEALANYLKDVEHIIDQISSVAHIEQYIEEMLTPDRANLRIRIRFIAGPMIEISEALVIAENKLIHLDCRYHCQDVQNKLLFRYDSAPHFPDLLTFPYHEHLPNKVIAACKPDIDRVIQEAMKSI
jgi:hypothetical protein